MGYTDIEVLRHDEHQRYHTGACCCGFCAHDWQIISLPHTSEPIAIRCRYCDWRGYIEMKTPPPENK